MPARTLLVRSLLILTLIATVANGQPTRIEDDSDWWSIQREDNGPEVEPKHKSISALNFQIAGVSLGEKQFEQAVAKLGKTEEIERGDASTGRHQVCYQSAKDGEKLHLIFEFGEVEETFYLFADGKDWEGSDRCARSKLVTASLRTASGLRLGLTRSQVETILGPPDFVSGERIVYSREVRRKTTPREFEQMRKDYPRVLRDEEAHAQFDFFDVGMYIEAKFVNSKLNYLAVSREETD